MVVFVVAAIHALYIGFAVNQRGVCEGGLAPTPASFIVSSSVGTPEPLPSARRACELKSI
jgi:hypothetical protein